MMFRAAAFLAALTAYQGASAFSTIGGNSQAPVSRSNGSQTALFGKNRKARRQQKVEKQTAGRSQAFFDAIEDANGAATKKKKPELKNKPKPQGPISPNDEREAYLTEVQRKMDMRPEVSTMIYDEETGTEVVAQGRSVMDVVTRKAVKLSDLGPEYRLAQMFPGVPPDVRAKYRMDLSSITIPEMVEKVREACTTKLDDGTYGIPPHPSVANKALDFVLANRDLLGFKMKRLLLRLEMRAFSQGNIEEGKALKKLAKNFLTIENHLSAPFRQILQDAEGRIGPNFGNLDLMAFSQGELYERVGNYLVLKGMVAHWEAKVVDADFVERKTKEGADYMVTLTRGDPKRYLPDPPILFTLKECTQVCAMAQKMCDSFVKNEELMADFPPEIIFLEDALSIRGGTALRKYMIDEFCPARGITPEGLREGMRRLYQQMSNMQIDPYSDLTRKIQDLAYAMSIGSEDEEDLYKEYLANLSRDGPGTFQTYTFNHPRNSMARFLDGLYPSVRESFVDQNVGDESQNESFKDRRGENDFLGLDLDFNIGNMVDFGEFGKIFGGDDGPPEVIGSDSLRQEPQYNKKEVYTPPVERALGRPHDLGWLEKTKEDRNENMKFGKVPPGRIIEDE